MYRTWGEPKTRRDCLKTSKYSQFNIPQILTSSFSCQLKQTCVQPKAFPRTVSSGSSCSLAGRGFGDGCDHQRFDGAVGVVGSQLYKCTVNDEHDPIYGNGGLSYVCGHHDLKEVGRKTRGYL